MRLFTDTLRDMRGGASLEDLTRAFHELVLSCCATGKGGTLTYSITVKPTKSAEAVEVTDKLDLKEPRNERGSSLFFVASNGDLTRNNPHQVPLDLREVEPPPAPRDVPLTNAQAGAL